MTSQLIESSLEEHIEAIEAVRAIRDKIDACAERMAATINGGGCVFACGNGGSAADAQHFAAELTGRFEKDRKGYASIALTTDTSALTSIGNDFGFDAVFSRQLEALGRPGDMLIAISTSGNSSNVLEAARCARRKGMYVVGLLGREGGELAHHGDLSLVVGVKRTARIQEAHIFILHLLCELFEAQL